ncbi:T9SS type A sorting domain-containing protein [Haliscomenobacter hydrossis]|uniref:Heme utilization protein n=1 Tax=Haliscomenobacter hydrossis (strain ATCC 27775 / DSM 1100 / LMG 10767 / O) TaxID=760192 RepID=F4L3F5_HALH1|nr:T9SS type A sorting domain-containing protein [Haliscomenobacter hydrossis]AEE52932.1 heme utilization protein [Haliscomenobacter hydrossis DSM 1100]
MKHNYHFSINILVVLTLLFFSSQPLLAHFGSRGPFGGSVSVAISNDSTVYVGTFNGGVYESTNSRLTAWRALPVGLRSGRITALIHSGTNLFAGTQDDGVYIYSGVVGTDKHWVRISNGLTNLRVTALVALDANTLIAGTESGGVYKTTDKGANWKFLNSAWLNGTTITGLLKLGNRIIASSREGGVFVTKDGNGWDSFSDGKTLDVGGTNSISYNAKTNELAVINMDGLFILSNASAVTGNINYRTIQPGLPSGTVMRSISNNGDNWFLTTNKGVYTSTTGATWTAANDGLATSDVTVALGFRTTVLLGTRKEGIYTTPASALNWVSRNTNFNNLETYAMESSGERIVVAATEKGIFVSRDLAASYVRANKGLSDSLNVTYLKFYGSSLYASTQNGGVFVSADTGKTWTALNAGLTNLHVKKIYASSNHVYILDDSYGVFQLNGSTWNSIQAGLPANTLLSSMAFYGSKILMGTLGQGVFTREVASGSWTAVNTGLGNLRVTSVATNGSKLFAGTDGAGVFVANLDAANWTPTAATSISHTTLMGLDGSKIQDMAYYAGYIFASYRGGLVASSDNGQTWIAGGNQFNLPSYTSVHKISFVTTRVFVSTEFNSVYSNALSELPAVVTSTKDFNPALNAAIRIVPNPNDGRFAIQLENGNTKVEGVTLFDNMGRRIQDFHNPNDLQNVQTSVQLPVGIYFVQIRTTGGLAVKRVVIR